MDQQQVLSFIAQLIAQLFHAAPAAPAGPPVGKVPMPAPVAGYTGSYTGSMTPTPAPEAAGPMIVQLSVVTVRRGGGVVVTDEVMAPGGVLMARDKVRLDSNELTEDGSQAFPVKSAPEDILWSFYYGDSETPDLEVRGDVYRTWDGKDLCGKHWLVSHQGIAQDGGIGSLANTAGFGIVAKLAEGDAGTSKWQVVCSHDGVLSDPVGGRAD